LREQHTLVTKKGVQIIVITPSKREFLEKFIDVFGPYPFPIYGDPGRTLYKKMGHQTMAKWKLLSIAAIAFLKYGKKAFLPQDEKQQDVVKVALKTHDIYIQGGTWIFDEKGTNIWKHVDQSPEDHATIEQILDAL
jgi:peroxiredoxin